MLFSNQKGNYLNSMICVADSNPESIMPFTEENCFLAQSSFYFKTKTLTLK